MNCPKCGGELKHIPAGISKKSGKHYDEFWSCQSCDYKTKFNPNSGASGRASGQPSQSTDQVGILPALREIYKVLTEIRDVLKRKDEWRGVGKDDIANTDDIQL